MYCCSDSVGSSLRHLGGAGYSNHDNLPLHDVELLKLKDSPVSVDRLTERTETSCDETSREFTPPTLETAQVEMYPGSSGPRYSTPKQDMQQSSFLQSIQHNGAPPQATTLHVIPEKVKQNHLPCSDISEFRLKSSPMLRGARFCSEVSNSVKFSIDMWIYDVCV